MTRKLYDENAYMREFEAKVISCTPTGMRWLVELDETAFFAEGGGQAGDTGTINGARVWDTHEKNGIILHTVSAPFEPGETVHGEIDWPERFARMQQHSGEHMVSGVVYRRFGYHNVGFHMGAEAITVDYDGEIDRETLAEIEAEVNAAIWENRPITARYPSAEELANMPYRSKKELTGPIRIVSCPGIDLCACCGTHVARTGEIGLVRLLSVQRFREGVRIEMLAGKQAFDYLDKVDRQNKTVSTLLSSKVYETAQAVERLQRELEAAKYTLNGLKNAAIARTAEEYAGVGDCVLFTEGDTPDESRRLADAVAARCGGVCALLCGSDRDGYRYVIVRHGGDVRPLTSALNAALSGRGGGKPALTQGTLTATKREIERFFREHFE